MDFEPFGGQTLNPVALNRHSPVSCPQPETLDPGLPLSLEVCMNLHGGLRCSGYLIGVLTIRESYSLGVYLRGAQFFS